MTDELALDTETTGSDVFHGCRPFLVTGCDGKYDYTWEGTVNPQTRQVTFKRSELLDLRERIYTADRIIFHNTNFDRRQLEALFYSHPLLFTFPIQKVEDTLVASHVLCSGDSHGLKDLALKYLQYSAEDERAVDNAVLSARALVQGTNVDIAKHRHEHFPGASKNTKFYKLDMWLVPDVTRIYGKHDTRRTWLLHQVFKKAFMEDIGAYDPQPFQWYPNHKPRNNLYSQYRFRLSVLPVLYDMQSQGIHIYIQKINRLIKHLEFQLSGLVNLIKQSANYVGYLNPDSPQHLIKLLYEQLNLTPPKYTETGQPSTDKESLKKLYKTHPEIQTLRYLQTWSECETELGYIRSYKLWATTQSCYWCGTERQPECPGCADVLSPEELEIPPSKVVPHTLSGPRLHSNVNLTGTDKTRCSSTDPNQQNFKKTLKYLFGPPEGYYWLYMDVVNIELRVWAYDIGDKELIAAFESDQSVHELIAQTIRPQQIKDAGGMSAWKKTDPIHKQYTNTKAGTFTWINGGSEPRVNRAYGISNAAAQIKTTFNAVAKFFDWLKYETQKNTNYYLYPTMFTLQGYPLHVSRVKPYIASSCRIQGTAGLIVQDMMVQVAQDPIYVLQNCRLIQQVHDSITFEIPTHSNMEQTNTHLKQTVERVGCKHIPTCPMDAEVILPSPNETFRLHMPTILPEEINGYTVTYYFEDKVGWIASGTYQDLPVPVEFIAPSYTESRALFIKETT